MNGFDDIGMTLAYEPDIAAFEEQRSDLLPSTSAAG
jgi:3-isopropylmalate dehydratase small subunit